MKKKFDYEKVFMSVTTVRSKDYIDKVIKEDYRLERLTDTVRVRKGKMLDIGCGGGTLTECFTKLYPNVRIFGCDISKTAISYANKYGKGNVKYSVIRNNILPYNTNSMDVIISFDVMEHVPNVHIFLKEIKRVLKKNGLLFMAIPCEGQPFTFTWFFQKINIGQNLTYKHVGHIHPEFTHNYIIKLLNKYNFKIVNKSFCEHLFYQLTTLFRFLLAKELLELFMGKEKAEKYYDRSIIAIDNKDKQRTDIIFLFRIIWLKLWRLINILTFLERKLLKNVSFGGWKIFILASNNK